MTDDSFTVTEADLSNTAHQAATLSMMDAYARDDMGDGRPLSDWSLDHLIAGLREHPTTLVFLVFRGTEPVGIATCFRGFSTFAARPLLNISDYFVLPACQGRGLGRRLMEAIEHRARELGCCRLTLEVQEHNHRARAIYGAAGFAQAVYVAEAGGSLYLAKQL
ncbi:MAG: GNAT family N-acetyltransferase [Verrucomicrobiaceae bacterium]|nr:GNAT family N-acetyltransferase [Verrucomicrobiaceae bacterium]